MGPPVALETTPFLPEEAAQGGLECGPPPCAHPVCQTRGGLC